MDIVLEKIHNPCVKFYFDGIPYDSNSVQCKHCEYNISIQLLKKILYRFEGCSLCKNRENIGGGYWDCKINCQEGCDGNHLSIDREAIIKDYFEGA